MFSRKLWLLLAALSSANPTLAQRSAVAPLAPVAPQVTTPAPRGTLMTQPSAARPAGPVGDHPSRTVPPRPVVLVNSRIIAGGGTAINPQDITDVHVYKGPDTPAQWRSLTAHGIIAITLSPRAAAKLNTTSLAAIRRGLHVRGPVRYQLEGLPLEDLTLRVVTADIAGLDAQPTASGTVVNIRLAVPPPVVYPPGTILIRGAAGS